MYRKRSRKKRYPSSENIDIVKRYNLWLLKVDPNEVDAGSPTNDQVTQHCELFKKLDERSLNPKWITSEECLQRKFKGSDIYVLPTFRGKVFTHLTSLKCRIYGPLALINCLKGVESLPRRHSPIWATTLRGAVVCFTGIEGKERKRQMSIVKMLGGIVSKAFTAKVTHLVADFQDTQSKKFVAAIDSSIPVLSISWISDAWKAAKAFNESKYIDEKYITEHKLHIFTKCVISCSGVPAQDRPTLSRIIEANGGVYTGIMRRNECTHLVTDLNSGEKYLTARRWGWNTIKIVCMRWITRSIEEGYRLPERLYETKTTLGIKCSTPLSSQLSGFQTPPDLGISAIRPSVDRHRTDPAGGDKVPWSATTPLRLTRSEITVTEINESIFTEKSPLRMKLPQRPIVTEDPIVHFDVDSLCFSAILRNCTIYFCGIADEVLKKYKWLISKVESSRCDQLEYKNITHVVVGPQRLDWMLIKQLKEKARSGVKVVTCEWLLDCAKAQKHLDETDYLIFKREESIVEVSRRPVKGSTLGKHYDIAALKRKTKLKITEIGIKLLSSAVGMLPSTDVDASKENISERLISDDDDDDGGDGDGGGDDDSDSDDSLFIGLSFRVAVKEEELRNNVTVDIESHGGKVESEREIWVNYMVCSVLDSLLNDNTTDFNCGDVVSCFWLQECLEKGAVMNANKHPLYRPIEAFNISQVFEGCIVGLSALTAAEKDAFTSILCKFGADVRIRPGNGKNMNICTQLVTGAETDRTDYARRYQIPVVDPSWIIESVIQNERQPVEQFLFVDQPLKNYTRKDPLWILITQQRSGISKSHVPDRELDIASSKQTVQETPSESHKRAIPKFSMTTTDQPVATQHVENPEIIEDETVEQQDRNMGAEENVEAGEKSQEPTCSSNPAAGLDLREAFAYVNQMDTQNTMTSSRGDETWSDTAVSHVLRKAVVKTAEVSDIPWSKSVKGADDYGRMQSRLSKRKTKSMEMSKRMEYPKKSKIVVPESHVDPAVASKEEKKKKLAEKLAKVVRENESALAAERAKFAMKVEREKQLEEERKTKKPEPENAPKPFVRRRNVVLPEPEKYGWEEDPRPIVTEILNPFEPDLEAENQEVPPLAEQDVENQGNKASTSEECENVVMEEAPATREKIICFTSITGHDRDALSAKVLELGGIVCNEFNERVTHLVCGNIVRNEKLLCSIAKGLTIVDEDFVIDSHAQSKWLEAEDYEWGSDHSMKKHSIPARFVSLAQACRRWRMKIEKNRNERAFQDWKAVIYCSRSRFQDLKRIIEFGGGKAHLRDDVSSLQGFTIALVEKSRLWNFREAIALAENNIQCFGIDYVAVYLTLEEGCEVEKYFHKDYASALIHKSRLSSMVHSH